MSTFGFDTEEKVLSYHGPLLYEASVIDRTVRQAPDGVTKIKLYLLHYSGWNSHWDEWVPESRLLKHNPQNLRVQKERVKEFQRAHKKRARAMTDVAGAAGAAGNAAGKRKLGDGAPSADEGLGEIREQLRLPQAMKLKLIEDWERITREKKLVPLPREPNIATLLDDFLQAKSKRTTHERLYGEVNEGMRTYFNQSLGSILLYKYERKQFRDLKETAAGKDKPLVELYGAEHLLRLFVKLPELLAQCKMQREHMQVLVSKLMELLKFIQANKAKYFVTQYESATDEYLAWWGNE